MHEKCCCGCCTLYAGTSVVLAFAAAEAVIGIIINIELLLLISESEVFNPLSYLINIEKVDDKDVFHGIVLAELGLNAFWFIFGSFAASGNIHQSHGRLTPWILNTYLISLFNFGLTIYFALKFQNSFSDSPEFCRGTVPTATLTYLTLLCIYSGGGIFLFLNFFFAHFVERRGKEIDQDFSTLALYILSHMSRCNQTNDEMQQNLLPPSYGSTCPPYLPPEIYQATEESWALSYEALKRIQTEEVNNMRINRSAYLRALMRENSFNDQPLDVAANETSALPY